MVVPGGRAVDPSGTAVVPTGAGGFPPEQQSIHLDFSFLSVTSSVSIFFGPESIQNYGELKEEALGE